MVVIDERPGTADRPADRQPDPTGVAGVIARPPRLFMGTLLLGLALDRLLPLPLAVPRNVTVRWIAASVLITAGVAVAAAAMRGFSRARTPVPTIEPTRALVTTGIHGLSRNPIYIGMFLVYAGLAAAVSSSWAFVLVLPLAVTMRYGVVAREEAYLERRFPGAYQAYRTRVRRWL